MEEKNTIENNSGQGAKCKVPDAVAKRFNWGACYFALIWGLFNKTIKPYIIYMLFAVIYAILYLQLSKNPDSLLSTIMLILGCFAGVFFFIYFGIKGNTWAWQNKRWKSIEHFHSVQKRWAAAVAILIVISFLASMSLPTMYSSFDKVKQAHPTKMIVYNTAKGLYSGAEMNKSYTYYDSETLAKLFEMGAPNSKRTGNIVEYDGYQLIFTGDGSCTELNNCYVNIQNNNDTITLRIINVNNKVGITRQDLEKYFNAK